LTAAPADDAQGTTVAERLQNVERMLADVEAVLQKRDAPARTLKAVRTAHEDVRRAGTLLDQR